MNEFPIGETLKGGHWRITECYAGEAARGYFAAVGKDGTEAIVTLAHYQKAPIDLAHYRMDSPGITPLLYAGRLETNKARYDGLVEERPRGAPLREQTLTQAEAIALVLDACSVVGEAHRRKLILRGIRPELLFVENGRVTAIAPRCEEFMAGWTPPSSGVRHPFSHYYLAPEILRLRDVTVAADVFSLGVILAELVTNEHPFPGENILEQLHAVSGNTRRAWSGPDSLRGIVDGALDPDPARRPSAVELARQLQRA